MGLETNEKIEQLLIQFANCRQEITEMIKEIEEISKIVKSLFPDKFDTRYRMIFTIFDISSISFIISVISCLQFAN